MGDDYRGHDQRRDNRRDGDGRRAQDQLADHQRNPYAHGELVGRLQTEGAAVRQTFEDRLRVVERVIGQVVIVAVVLGILLGAGAGVVLARLLK